MNRHQMEAKRYLSQAFGINKRIESKLDQIQELRDLATKATISYSDMPYDPNKGKSRVEDSVIKIVDLEGEINRDVLELVDLKVDIIRRINEVENTELRTILDLRYLKYMRWEQIAAELGYGMSNTYELHTKALDAMTVPDIPE